MSLAALCTHEADIESVTHAADTYGGQTATFAAFLSGVPCSLQPASGRIVEEFARRGMRVDFTMYSPTDISGALAGYRVTIDSVKYLVVWAEDQAGRGSVFAVHLLRKD
jgi:hypothetical protein